MKNSWFLYLCDMFVCLLLTAKMWQTVQGDIYTLPKIGTYLRALFSGKVFHPFSREMHVRPLLRGSYYAFVIPATVALPIVWVMCIVQLVRQIMGPIPQKDLYQHILTTAIFGDMLYTGLVLVAFGIIWDLIYKKTNNTPKRKR